MLRKFLCQCKDCIGGVCISNGREERTACDEEVFYSVYSSVCIRNGLFGICSHSRGAHVMRAVINIPIIGFIKKRTFKGKFSGHIPSFTNQFMNMFYRIFVKRRK